MPNLESYSPKFLPIAIFKNGVVLFTTASSRRVHRTVTIPSQLTSNQHCYTFHNFRRQTHIAARSTTRLQTPAGKTQPEHIMVTAST